MSELLYRIAPTLERFHLSPAFGRFIIGPFGSGKSTSAIMELVRVAATQEQSADGRRYSRFAVVRNTLQSLKQTTLPDIQQQLGPILHYHVSEATVRIRTDEIVSDWIMVPLEEINDVRRLLSMQLTMAWIEEFREVKFEILASLAGRVGRYPSKSMGGCSRYGVIGTSNPFAEGTDWYNFLVLNPPSGYELFKQPSGLSEEAENVENLPPGYYDRLAEGHTEDWVKVHVHGEYGDDLSGTAVFRAAFSYPRHVVDHLVVQPNQTVVVGLDLGRTPTAVVGQVDYRGRVLVLDELSSEDMGLEQFVNEKLRPLCFSDRYANRRFVVVYDPAGLAKSTFNDLTAGDILARAGFAAMPAPTNDIAPRLRSVESLLLQSRGEQSALVLDRERCSQLIKALRFEYKYRRKKDQTLEEVPAKTHPWSDLADALQYLCLAINLDLPGRVLRRIDRSSARAQRPKISAAAWT